MSQADERVVQRLKVPGLRCSDETRLRHDPLLATAPQTAGWLLIEEPGSWGRDAPAGSLDPSVLAQLTDRTKRAGVRMQLIRRSRQRRVRTQQRTVVVVNSEPGAESVSWHTVHTDHELLDVPLDGAGRTDGKPEPIYLVCTHGTRDVCCAVWGRPVAEHLTSHRPAQTWETSHVGGHRFAANLVVLPHGLYYGQVTPDEALVVAKAYEAGHVVPGHLRGRSVHPPPAQAAEHFARLELGETGLDALKPGEPVILDPGTWQVPFTWDAGSLIVTVRTVSASPARMSCRDQEPSTFDSFELVTLRAL